MCGGQYEAKFPGGGRNGLARQNWDMFRSDLKCSSIGSDDDDNNDGNDDDGEDDNKYLCGLQLRMKGEQLQITRNASGTDGRML